MHHLKNTISLLFYCIFLWSSNVIAFSNSPTVDKTLANGLRVLVFEDHSAPTVIQMTVVRAGSIDEVDGKSGIAHVLEHMMFKRTETMKEGEFSRIIGSLGGQENAFTSREITGYHQQVHRDHLETIIKLEADRMQNLVFKEEDFKKEIQVVLQERLLRTDDNPRGRAYETLFAQAFQASPIRRPIIGWRNDILSLELSDAKEWYDQWYVPNNITVIIAGAVESKTVVNLIEKYYGATNRASLPRRKPQTEPSQVGQRRIKLSAPAENKFFLKLWKAPVISKDSGDMVYENDKVRQVVAMGVLGVLLGDEDTGILTKKLVRESQKAVSISIGSSWMSRGPGYFVIDATPSAGVSIDELESEIQHEIKNVLRARLPEKYLNMVKRRAKADQIYQKDSLMSQVREASLFITNQRNLSDSKNWLKVLESITFEDVVEVGKLIFDEQKSTVLLFYPEKLKNNKL